MNFAKKCKELRIKKAATQEQMAIALNLSSQAVSKWENGVSQTSRYHTKTHAYITSKQYNLGGKHYETLYILRI